ncbi:MAG TPA: 3'(2'),5'-bisphosphate nucleotidase CysQ [Longimicrobium sp.]|nr:3'(2'),5'-bisphosphate nucleotidase CysQ [Longimicrobium sp.]
MAHSHEPAGVLHAPAATSGPWAGELAAARAAAREAGHAAMAHYGTATQTGVSGGGPVTEADRAANAVIVARLRAAFPSDALLSEELRDTPGRLSASRLWVVDPLDGTREFLAGNGEFAVMVGLAVDGRAVLGAVYLPVPDRLYFAAEDSGAWVEEAGAVRPVRCGPADPAAPRLVGSRSHPDPLAARMQRALGAADVRPAGSVGVKCALIAEGERDVYLHPVPHLKEWDTCAPEVILREAGGAVADCRGAPLRYNKPDPRQPDGIVACGPGLLAHVLARIAPLYAESVETAAADAAGR